MGRYAVDDTDRGACIGSGLSHRVYHRRGSPWVQKIPMYPNTFVFTYEDHARHLSLLQQYMGEFLLPTRIVRDTEYGYILHQEYLSPLRPLTLSALRDFPRVREDFARLLSRNDILYRETGCSVDFFGKDGVVGCVTESLCRYLSERLRMTMRSHAGGHSVHLSNLVITGGSGDERIQIIDITLSDIRHARRLARIVGRVVNFCNGWGLRHYFGTALPSDYVFLG